MIHLDTSFLIRALIPGTPQDQAIRGWIADGESLAMSVIGWTEFLCGPVEERHAGLVAALLAECIAFTEADAEIAARLFNDSGRRRGSLIDCMIAAAALRANAPLATVNVADFQRFEPLGLALA